MKGAVERISTEVHGAIDLAFGTLMIVLPWLFQFDDDVRARGVAVGVGATVLALVALTRYDFGLLPLIPMPVHLAVDMLIGVCLLTFALGGGLAGAGVRVWAAYVAAGAAAVVVAAATDPVAPWTSARERLAP
jgi:hypothetical protein